MECLHLPRALAGDLVVGHGHPDSNKCSRDSAVSSSWRPLPLSHLLHPSVFPSLLFPFHHWVRLCEPTFWTQAALEGAWCLLQIDTSLWSWRPPGTPPPKSPKPVDRTGSQLSAAIAWRLEFQGTVPNILDQPGCGLWYRSEQKVQ